MDLGYVKKLIRLLSDSQIDEIEIEEDGKRIRLAKGRNNTVGAYQSGGVPVPAATPALPQPAALPVVAQAETPRPATTPAIPATPLDKQLHEIKSPIVGTFYRAPAPDAAPFVEVGSIIQPGTVLCIVEAMKLMNEIEADVSGRITRVLVENGQPVEYDQALFLVEAT
jgi:acetyl-CoA carboxylase biotin carboxyl carrier protein